MKTLKRIKWNNIIMLIIGTVSTVVFLNDYYQIIFGGATFTTFGFVTNIALYVIGYKAFNYVFHFDV